MCIAAGVKADHLRGPGPVPATPPQNVAGSNAAVVPVHKPAHQGYGGARCAFCSAYVNNVRAGSSKRPPPAAAVSAAEAQVRPAPLRPPASFASSALGPVLTRLVQVQRLNFQRRRSAARTQREDRPAD